jgi:uncharacterized protein (TIGR02466 family)
MNFKIQELFPIALYKNKLNFKLNKKQMKFATTCDRKLNTYNISSLNSFVLELPLFKNLKKAIEEKTAHYLLNIEFAPPSTEFFITQSWFNYTKKGQAHHEHEHPNSFLSGVYYINADKKLDSITFVNKRKYEIQLPVNNYNFYNSKSFNLPVSTDDFIMFPSSTTHRVEIKDGKNERLSLAFNVFIKGDLGDKKGLWNLKI